MKVRNRRAITSPMLFPSEPTLMCSPTGTRNRAHHLQEGHDGPEQVREGPPRPGEDQRRVKVRLRHADNTNTIPLSLGQFPFGTVCLQYIRSRGLGLNGGESQLDWHCHISLLCTEFRGIFPFIILRPSLSPCAPSQFSSHVLRSESVHKGLSPIYAALSCVAFMIALERLENHLTGQFLNTQPESTPCSAAATPYWQPGNPVKHSLTVLRLVNGKISHQPLRRRRPPMLLGADGGSCL